MANESRLVLPKPMMVKLASLGVYCQTWVTAERQDRAKRWFCGVSRAAGAERNSGDTSPSLRRMDRGWNGCRRRITSEQTACTRS
jgi:hypothetical protein